MSTIGDPLADFGWMLTYWSEPSDSEARRGVVSSMEPHPGYLTRREMVELYEQKSGRAMDDVSLSTKPSRSSNWRSFSKGVIHAT